MLCKSFKFVSFCYQNFGNRIFTVSKLDDTFFYPSDVRSYTFCSIFSLNDFFVMFFFYNFILPSVFSLTDSSIKTFTARFYSDEFCNV